MAVLDIALGLQAAQRAACADSCWAAGAQLPNGQFQLPHLTPEMAKLAQNGALGALFQGQSPHLMGLPTAAYPTAQGPAARGLAPMPAHMPHVKLDPSSADMHRHVKPENGKGERQPALPLKAEQVDQQVLQPLGSQCAARPHDSFAVDQSCSCCWMGLADGQSTFLLRQLHKVPSQQGLMQRIAVQGESDKGFVQATPQAEVGNGRPGAGRMEEDLPARMHMAGAGDAYAALSQLRHLPHAPGKHHAARSPCAVTQSCAGSDPLGLYLCLVGTSVPTRPSL